MITITLRCDICNDTICQLEPHAQLQVDPQRVHLKVQDDFVRQYEHICPRCAITLKRDIEDAIFNLQHGIRVHRIPQQELLKDIQERYHKPKRGK